MHTKCSAFVDVVILCFVAQSVVADGPMPEGTSTITVTYETGSGPVAFAGARNYSGRLGDQTPLGAAPNISAFNSAGSVLGVFGRRTAPILMNNPALPDVFFPDESLITHALFKIDNDQVFFPAFAGNRRGEVTITVDNIHFAEPVVVLKDTLMLHAKWRAEQVDLLDEFYISLDNHHTITDSFRDFDTFMNRIFFDFPAPNYVINDADLQWAITGERTDTLSISVTFPYEILENLEENGQVFPPGVPAPEGFLEPFHFHIEYIVAPAADHPIPASTTKLDFFRGGSQPSESYEQILSSRNCGACHGDNDPSILINQPWRGSMHGLSARDPLWAACLTIAEQDAPFVGDMCIRCHVPRAWISGRSTPTDGSAINETDRDGITCHYCHRLVDPFFKPGVSPVEDELILDAIVELPVSNDGASFVLDPADGRRSTRGTSILEHTTIASPFHSESAICETCHDVSNPALDRQPDGTYTGNALDAPHPTGEKYDMFPGERTFSEWSVSEYAAKGVDAGGLFGGNKLIVSTCQDCHMPDSDSLAAVGGPLRDDMADHGMYGGGTWIPLVVANMYPDDINLATVQAGAAGSRSMLERAATFELTQSGDSINVRIINETGHKLPTGQPEGRQMWLNVRFFDGADQLVAERGAYDPVTAKPTVDDTTMYEIHLGIDESTASATGLTAGPTHHVAFCNVIYFDNRIPPRGFTNAEFDRISAPVVGVGYSDGQHWDDSQFRVPRNATRIDVALYYKTASTEFIEFLRDANHANDAGQVLYDQWEQTGKSPPVEMISGSLALSAFAIGDLTGDTNITIADLPDFLGCMQGPGIGPVSPACREADIDGDDDVDLQDIGRYQARFETTE